MTQTSGRGSSPGRRVAAAAKRNAVTASDAVRGQVRALRDARGWSARELAERCAAAGAPQLDRDVIANIEAGRRRSISVDELMVLALVLDVSPVHLLVPPGDSWVAVSPETTMHASLTRAWVRGETSAPGQDRQRFVASLPPEEFELVMSPGQAFGFMATGATTEKVGTGVYRFTPNQPKD